MSEARMKILLSFFQSFFLSFFFVGCVWGGGGGGGGGALLSPFCVALAEDSNKCFCYYLFQACLVVYIRLRRQITLEL